VASNSKAKTFPTPGVREFIIRTTHDDIGGMVADMGIKPNAAAAAHGTRRWSAS